MAEFIDEDAALLEDLGVEIEAKATGAMYSHEPRILGVDPQLWFQDSQFLFTHSPFTKETYS